MEPQPSEIEALDAAGRLMRFAAENRAQKDMPEAIVGPITEAWKQRDAKTWDATIATKFWVAYSGLCDVIKPATLDSIAINAGIKRPRWIFFGPLIESSMSKSMARWCLYLLMAMLLLSIISGFVASSSSTLSHEVQTLIEDGNRLAGLIRDDIESVRLDLEKRTGSSTTADRTAFDQPLDDQSLPEDTRRKVAKLRADLQALYADTDTMYQKVQTISAITMFGGFDDYYKGDLTPVPNLEDAVANLTSYYTNRRSMSETLQKVWVLTSIYNAFVPMLLGAMGACTYVLRLISDQIKDTTFSRTSPIRHVVRIALGALTGVVIGFGGIISGAALSSAALSFIAGYAVEPVFATFDGIAEKFRR
jgi:hypothetical protein